VLGSAILAAAGAKVYPSVTAAAQNMVTVERTIQPDPARHEEYRFYVDRYIETYPLLRDVIHSTVRHAAATGAPAAVPTPAAEAAPEVKDQP
jgi:sugar (pentulose or hexulose) kinase